MGREAKMCKAISKIKQVSLPTEQIWVNKLITLRLAVTSSAPYKCVKEERGGLVYLCDVIVKPLQCFLAVSESVAGAFT